WVTPDPPQRARGRVVGDRRRDRDEGGSRDIHRMPAWAHGHIIAGGIGFAWAQPGPQGGTGGGAVRDGGDVHVAGDSIEGESCDIHHAPAWAHGKREGPAIVAGPAGEAA